MNKIFSNFDTHTQKLSNKALELIDYIMVPLILLNVLAVVLETEISIYAKYKDYFVNFELGSIIIFTIEYITRLFLFARTRGNFWKKITTPIMIIDLLVILPFYLTLFFGVNLGYLRVFRMVRLVKLTRYTRSIKLFGQVLSAKREELVVSLGILAILIVFAATGIYYVEKEQQPDDFGSIPKSIWWAIITVTSVGYGDVTPVTTLGKALAGIVAILGVGLFAIPTGFIAAGFSDQFQREKEEIKEKKNGQEGSSSSFCPHCGKHIDYN